MIYRIGQLLYEDLQKQADLIQQVMTFHVGCLSESIASTERLKACFLNRDYECWADDLRQHGFSDYQEFMRLESLRDLLANETFVAHPCTVPHERFLTLHQEFYDILQRFHSNIHLVLNLSDYLTQLPNRKLFEMMMDKRRLNGVLAMADIDRFKRINDGFGHPAGDDVLSFLGQTFRKTVRKGDVVARYGGEEFLFYLPDITLDDAEIVFEKLRHEVAVSSPLTAFPITCSFGLAEVQNNSFEQTIAGVDKALYVAKKGGRNRVAVLSSR